MQAADKESLDRALKRLYARTAHGIRPGLDIIRRLLVRLDHPEKAFPLIHIAGTNGKGSVCALIESVLRRTGIRTARYTSPHLIHFNERIHVAGKTIPDADLARWIDRVEHVAKAVEAEPDARPPTFFECATALAYGYFAEQQVQCAVFETGLGGRWDATNTGHPIVSVITHIDIDHTGFLGTDIRSIAGEKAGILKHGVPAVLSRQCPEALSVLLDTARSVGAPVIRAEELVQIERLTQDWDGQKIRISTPERALPAFTFPLIGRHQLENAAVAVAALDTLQSTLQIALADEDMVEGLRTCSWPARAQVIGRDPVVLLDVAHNPDGAASLAALLKEKAKGVPVHLVVGFLQDKDVAGCLAAFARVAHRLWAVSIQGERGLSAEAVRDIGRSMGYSITCGSLTDVIEKATTAAREDGGMVCIAGSLYLAGEVLQQRRPSV